jgi:drug/metabolite transporter (DMT)-like permease
MPATLRANLLLLVTASIWGFAFVAQRIGMDFVGPFAFNAARFIIGATVLLPLVLLIDRQKKTKMLRFHPPLLKSGIIAGVLLFCGATLQQVGLLYTTAGKAGFITGLYVVIVPLMGIFMRQRTNVLVWAGAILAMLGMYFLSVTSDFTIGRGDLLMLLGAFVWAAHVQWIGRFPSTVDPLKLSIVQFYICGLLSLVVAIALETTTLSQLSAGFLPILYAGLLSTGVGYTLQVIAQQDAHPAAAAIILSLEALFAVIGGYLFLNELLSARDLVGCALMMSGMLLAQFAPQEVRKNNHQTGSRLNWEEGR